MATSSLELIKLNVDGAIFFYRYKAEVGIILRGTKGDIVMFASKLEAKAQDLAIIKLLAMFWGLQLCANMRIANLILESDCLMMVDELQNVIDSHYPQRVLVQETKRLTQLFRDCRVKHINQLGNETAHRLACYAWNVENIEMWWDIVPVDVSQALWLDKNTL
ncbi:uncharacterized protein LOC122289301 [Carya illinoinensis]|uniref:uncharacterized protein LOC122289301 n=1 Tax=Carya illinoinensis TaxID=32201 RepID=UPI001C71B14B|nr:uncharacterized protein LOC122289301 [Carya illinoinensis]